MSTKFTPTIASLTRDLKNADRAASDRLAHCKRLTQENAELLAVLKAIVENYDLGEFTVICNETGEPANFDTARAIIARIQE